MDYKTEFAEQFALLRKYVAEGDILDRALLVMSPRGDTFRAYLTASPENGTDREELVRCLFVFAEFVRNHLIKKGTQFCDWFAFDDCTSDKTRSWIHVNVMFATRTTYLIDIEHVAADKTDEETSAAEDKKNDATRD